MNTDRNTTPQKATTPLKVQADSIPNNETKKVSPVNDSKVVTPSKINTNFYYQDHMIFKVWDAFIQSKKLSFYCGDSGIKNTLFTGQDGMSADIRAGLLVQENGKLYRRSDNSSISICQSVDYENKLADAGDDAIVGSLGIALTQIAQWNSQAEEKQRISKHIIIFSYHVSFNHWNLGELRLEYDDVLKKSALAIHEPLHEKSILKDEVKNSVQKILNTQTKDTSIEIKDFSGKKEYVIYTAQQQAGAACGAISAENGKDIIEGTQERFKKIYPSDAFELRKSHCLEVKNDRFNEIQEKDVRIVDPGKKILIPIPLLVEKLKECKQKVTDEKKFQKALVGLAKLSEIKEDEKRQEVSKTFREEISKNKISLRSVQINNNNFIDLFFEEDGNSLKWKDNALDTLQSAAQQLVASLKKSKQQQDKDEANKKSDLDNLSALHTLLVNWKKNDFKEEDLESNLYEIGGVLHGIAWDKKSSKCIRNKHGKRNRHEDEGNNLNAEGGKLDFEMLGHLKELSQDKAFLEVFKKDKKKIEVFINSLLNKVTYILYFEDKSRLSLEESKEYENKGKSENSDLGFNFKLCAHYYDLQCIGKMLEHLKFFKSMAESKVDFNNKIFRYALAYTFCQIGEMAKETSDFLKPEDSKIVENNLMRYFFGKLGKYRQNIKDDSYIVRNEAEIRFFQMFFKLFEKYNELYDVLGEIKKKLEVFFKDYKNKGYELDLYTKNDITQIKKKIEGLTDSLNEGITNFEEKLEGIKTQEKELKEAKKRLEDKIKDKSLEDKKKTNSVSSQIEDQLIKSPGLKQIRSILDKSEIQDKMETKIKLLASFVGKKNKIDSLLSTINSKLINTVKVNLKLHFKIVDIEEITLSELKRFIEKLSFSSGSEQNDEERLKNIKKNIDEKSKEKEHLEKLNAINKARQICCEYLAETKSNILDPESQKNKDQKSLKTNLIAMQQEIDFINSFTSKLNSTEQRAVKMSAGFLGLCSERMKDSFSFKNISKYINALVQTCLNQSMYVRAKHIMHDTANSCDEKVFEILSQHILPTQKDLRALYAVANKENGEYLVLAQSFMRLGFWSEAISVLDNYIEMLGKGMISVNYSSLLEKFNNDPSLKEVSSSLNKVFKLLDKEKQKETMDEAHFYHEKQFALLLKLNCYIRTQDVKNGYETACNLTSQTESLLQKFNLSIGLNRLLEGLTDGLFLCLMYAELQKSYFLLLLNKKDSAYSCLQKIKDRFDTKKLHKKEYSDFLKKIYTDLINYNKNNFSEKLQQYLKGLSLLVSEERIIIEYDRYFQKYEMSQKNLTLGSGSYEEVKKSGNDLIKFFEDRKTLFKENLGITYYKYAMRVELVDLNISFHYRNLEKTEKIFMNLDSMSRNVEDIGVVNLYYDCKLIYLSFMKRLEEYKKTLNQFFEFNIKHRTQCKFNTCIFNVLNVLNEYRFLKWTCDFVEKNCKDLSDQQKKILIDNKKLILLEEKNLHEQISPGNLSFFRDIEAKSRPEVVTLTNSTKSDAKNKIKNNLQRISSCLGEHLDWKIVTKKTPFDIWAYISKDLYEKLIKIPEIASNIKVHEGRHIIFSKPIQDKFLDAIYKAFQTIENSVSSSSGQAMTPS